MLLLFDHLSRLLCATERAEATVGRDEGPLGTDARLESGQPVRGAVVMVDFLPRLHSRSDGATALEIPCRDRVAEALRS